MLKKKDGIKLASLFLAICIFASNTQIFNVFALGYKDNSENSGATLEPGDILTPGDTYIGSTFIDDTGNEVSYSDNIYIFSDDNLYENGYNGFEYPNIREIDFTSLTNGAIKTDDYYLIDSIRNIDRKYSFKEFQRDYFKYNYVTGENTPIEVEYDWYNDAIYSVEGENYSWFQKAPDTIYYEIDYIIQNNHKYLINIANIFDQYNDNFTANYQNYVETYSINDENYETRPTEYLETIILGDDVHIPTPDKYVVCDDKGGHLISTNSGWGSDNQNIENVMGDISRVNNGAELVFWNRVGTENAERTNGQYTYYVYEADENATPFTSLTNMQTVMRLIPISKDTIVKTDLSIGDELIGGKTYLLLYMEDDADNYKYNYNYVSGSSGYNSPNNFNFNNIDAPFVRNVTFSSGLSNYLYKTPEIQYKDTINSTDTKLSHSGSQETFQEYMENLTGENNNYRFHQCGYIVTVPGDESCIWTYSGLSEARDSSNEFIFGYPITYNFISNNIFVTIKNYLTDEIIDIKTFDRDTDITNLELDGYYGFYDSNLNSVDVSGITNDITLYTLPISIDMNVYNASTYNMYNSNISADSVGKFILNNTESSVLQYSFVRPENISEEDYPVLSVITNSYNTTYYGQNIDGIKPSLLKSIYSRVHYCISNGYNAGVLAFPSKVYAKFYDGVTGYQINTSSYVNAGGFWQITNISDIDIPNINDTNIDNHVVLSQVPNFTTQLHLSSDMSSDYPYMICRIDDIAEDDLEVFDTMEISDYENLCNDNVDIYCGILEDRLATCINAAEETYNITKIRGQQKRATFDSFVTASNPGIDNQLRKFPTFDASLPYTTYNTTNPISGMAYMATASIHLKPISTFAELKDADGYYTELYCMDYYGKLAFAIVPSDTSITIYHGSATNNYDESHADTFTSVDDYNNFLNETNEQYGFTYVTLQRELSKDMNNNALKTALFISTGADDSFVTNYSKDTNPAYFHGTACFYVSYSKTISQPALGHLWGDDWIKIGGKNALNNTDNYSFISDINSNVVDADTLFSNSENENADELRTSLNDSNNVLYGILCSRASDAYELKIEHTHSYGDPEFTWSDNYSECTAKFNCTSDDDSQELDCEVTVDSQNPTCTVDGWTKYTATVEFNDAEYKDIVTINANHTGHTYGNPVFNWFDDYEECTAVFKCVKNDDTKELECDVTKEHKDPTYDKDGKDEYTAKVTFNNQEYSDVKTIPIPKLTDNAAPSIEIKVDANTWRSLLNKITFNLFFKDYKEAVITATDDGSGVKSLQYYVSQKPLTEAEVYALTNWSDYIKPVKLEQNSKCVVYAKSTDNANNIGYASSDGMVFDSIAPIITPSSKDDTILVSEEVVKITDNMALSKVTVDGIEQKIDSETETVLTITNDANLDTTVAHTIKAVDKAGNETEKTITFSKSDFVAKVGGYIRDINGNPVSGATVKLHSIERTATTDENGHFEFENVEVDNHTLEAYKDNDQIYEVSMLLTPTYVETDTKYMSNSFTVSSDYTYDDKSLTVIVNADECENHVHGREEKENEILPTCIKGGSYDLVSYCPNCGGEYFRRHEFTDALGHIWSDEEWKLVDSKDVTKELIDGADNNIDFSSIKSNTKVYKRLCNRASDAYEIKLVQENTETPTKPEVPETPTEPETPSVPETPTTPDIPNKPDVTAPNEPVQEQPAPEETITDTPITGDSSPIATILAVVFLAGLTSAGSLIYIKRRKNK